jgi:2-C-methyl-D-erythritol 4-phosphate cytidylyltransferase
VHLLLLAAGASTRMAAGIPKVLLSVAEKSVLQRSLEAFGSLTGLVSITICIPAAMVTSIGAALASMQLPPAMEKMLTWIVGGEQRADSVRLGVDHICEKLAGSSDDYILIHDAARCLVTSHLINAVLSGLEQATAVIPVLEVSDSVIRVPNGTLGKPSEYLDRAELRLVQTPQGFRLGALQEKLQVVAATADTLRTDEGSLFSATLSLVPGERTNRKLTFPEDLAYAEAVIREQSISRPS